MRDADKDMLERDVLKQKLPQAAIQSCLFHVLRTFRREVTGEKMGISQEQRLGILSILQRLAYADSEEIYTTAYVELVGLGIGKLTAYYNKNWHPIRDEWVQGMKHTKFSMLNSTNNRVESLNKHLKSVITKYSNIVTFFRDLKLMLAAMETERNHRALKMCQKAPARAITDPDLLKYSDLLTPYALRFVSTELTRSTKQFVVPPSTTTTSCDCHFRHGMMLPCMHIFKLRRTSNVPVFESSLCAERWGKDYFLTDHPMFRNSTSPVRVPRWPAAAMRNTSKSAPEVQEGISCLHATRLRCQRSVR